MMILELVEEPEDKKQRGQPHMKKKDFVEAMKKPKNKGKAKIT